MRRLGAADILALCDLAPGMGLASLALEVLARAEPEDGHARLTLGERDALLLDVRARTFGPRMELLASCPACGARAEVSLTPEDLGLVPSERPGTPPQPETRALAGHDITVTPVTAGLLAEAETAGSPGAIRRHLLAATVLAVDGDPAAPLPHDAAPLVESLLADLDPLAEIELGIACPACGAAWEETLDVPNLIRSDIEAHGARLLGEVAALARAYHWSERDILALPPARRRFYLEAASA